MGLARGGGVGGQCTDEAGGGQAGVGGNSGTGRRSGTGTVGSTATYTASASVTWINSTPRSATTSTRMVRLVRPVFTHVVWNFTTSPTRTGSLNSTRLNATVTNAARGFPPRRL